MATSPQIISTSALPPLEVRHTPNPCNQHSSPAFAQDAYPFMWYYRTEVHNHTDHPLHIVWFESYFRVKGQWVANNIKRRELNDEDFHQWYGDPNGKPFTGAIPPHSFAVCSVNWHGGLRPWSAPVRWVYRAVDDAGQEYHAESQLTSKIVLNIHTLRWAVPYLTMAAVAIYFVIDAFLRRSR